MKKIFILIAFILIGCGADEANVDSQEFVSDFGTNILNFYTADCHDQLAVSEVTNIWTLHINNSEHYNFHGIDREVIHNVGIQYSSDDRNFELTKHFDGQIVLKYDDQECLLPYPIGT